MSKSEHYSIDQPLFNEPCKGLYNQTLCSDVGPQYKTITEHNTSLCSRTLNSLNKPQFRQMRG